MFHISLYRRTKRENPLYLVINANTFEILRVAFLLMNVNSSDYYAGLKVLIDSDLQSFMFRVVGE